MLGALNCILFIWLDFEILLHDGFPPEGTSPCVERVWPAGRHCCKMLIKPLKDFESSLAGPCLICSHAFHALPVSGTSISMLQCLASRESDYVFPCLVQKTAQSFIFQLADLSSESTGL